MEDPWTFVHQRSAWEAAGGLLSVHWIRFLVGLAVRLTGVASGFSVFVPRLRLDILPDAWPLDFEMASELSSLAVVSDFLIRRCGGLAHAASLYNFKRRFHPAGNRAIWFIPAPSRALRVGLALASAHLSRQWLPWARLAERRKRAVEGQVASAPLVA